MFHEDEDWVECDGYWLKGREGGYISTDYEGETPEGCTVMVFMSSKKDNLVFGLWIRRILRSNLL